MADSTALPFGRMLAMYSSLSIYNKTADPASDFAEKLTGIK